MDRGNPMCLVIALYFPKYSLAFQMHSITATSVFGGLIELFSLESTLKDMFTARRQCFNSRKWYWFEDKQGFKHTTSNTHYPQLNGYIERYVRALKNALTKAKTSKISIPQASVKLRQNLITSRKLSMRDQSAQESKDSQLHYP